MDPRRAAVLDVARSWIRTPWHHRASVKGAGVDCGQLLRAVFVEAGLVDDFVIDPYPQDFALHRNDERFLAWVERFCDPVDRPEPADIAVFRFGRCFSHGAIVVDWPLLIHAYMPERGVTLGDASQGGLARKPVRFYSRFSRIT